MKNLTKQLKEQINNLYEKYIEAKENSGPLKSAFITFPQWLDRTPTEEDEPKEEIECAGCEYIHKWADRKYERREGISSSRCPNCDEESYIKLPPLNQSNPLSKEKVCPNCNEKHEITDCHAYCSADCLQESLSY